MEILRLFQIDVFLSRKSLNTFIWRTLNQKKKWENLKIFHKNCGLSPLKKMQILQAFQIDVFIFYKGYLCM